MPIVFGLWQVNPTASLSLRIWFTVAVIAPMFFGLLMIISPVRAAALQYWLLGLGRSNDTKVIRMLHSSVLWYRISGMVFSLVGLVCVVLSDTHLVAILSTLDCRKSAQILFAGQRRKKRTKLLRRPYRAPWMHPESEQA